MKNPVLRSFAVVATALVLTACAEGDPDPELTILHDDAGDPATPDTGATDPVGETSPPSTGETGAPDPDTGTPGTDDSGPGTVGGLHFERAYGNGTSLMGSWGAGVTLGVLVTDGAGKPAAGVPVAWSTRTGDFAYFPAAGGGTTLTVATDESGWSIPGINAPNPTVAVVESVMTAKLGGASTESRDFYVQTTNNGDSMGPMGQQAFTGTSTPNHSALGPYTVGSTVPGALTFTVVCSNGTRCPGTALANVSVRINLPDAAFPSGKSDPKLDPPAECVGVEPLSDDKGFIRCDLRLKRKFSGVMRAAVGQFVEFEYTLTAN